MRGSSHQGLTGKNTHLNRDPDSRPLWKILKTSPKVQVTMFLVVSQNGQTDNENVPLQLSDYNTLYYFIL